MIDVPAKEKRIMWIKLVLLFSATLMSIVSFGQMDKKLETYLIQSFFNSNTNAYFGTDLKAKIQDETNSSSDTIWFSREITSNKDQILFESHLVFTKKDSVVLLYEQKYKSKKVGLQIENNDWANPNPFKFESFMEELGWSGKLIRSEEFPLIVFFDDL